MGRVLTNNTAFSYAFETAIGVASEVWKTIEPNAVPQYGPEISTVARTPISKNRQRKKGTITDLDSSVEIEADMTLEHLIDFLEGFVFASAAGGPAFDALTANLGGGTDFFEVGLDADPSGLTTDHLVWSRGFTVSGNNGLHEVTADAAPVAASSVLTFGANPSANELVTIGTTIYKFVVSPAAPFEVDIGAAATDSLDNLIVAINLGAGEGTLYGTGTTLHPTVSAATGVGDTMDTTHKVPGTVAGQNAIVTTTDVGSGSWTGATLAGGLNGQIVVAGSTLVDETPAATLNATVEVAGVRGAAGDLTIDSSGNLVSSSMDFTTLDLVLGQAVHIGGATANRFFGTGIDENFGFARITAISANLLTLDKKVTTFVTDDGTDDNNGGNNLEIDILFGRFIRNVSIDDADFLERSFTFEAAWNGLATGGGDEYEYAKGNFCNELTFDMPLTDKAGLNAAFIGTDTDAPTGSRKTGASAPKASVQSTAFNTTADIARLRVTEVDETGLTTDFKSMTLTLNNNVSPEKVLSVLGARFMNTGIFEIDIETQVLFTNGDVLAAIRANTTVTMDFSLQNSDGGFFVDIPAMTLGDGSKDLPVNETVLLNVTAIAFEDPTLGTSLAVSIFPWLPSA